MWLIKTKLSKLLLSIVVVVFSVCTQVKTQLYHPPELPCLGHIQINVSAIGEDGLIYARTQNAGAQKSTTSLS